MSIQQILDVPENGQLHIQLPAFLQKNKKVRITIEDAAETTEAKIAKLKMAINDKDFINDLEEVKKEFDFAESKIEE